MRITSTLLVLSITTTCAVACGGSSSPTPDAGGDSGLVTDGGGSDATTPDATMPPADAARPDSATPDATTPDATTADGATPDAGRPDGATPDAGRPDAALPDAAARDAGGDAGCVMEGDSVPVVPGAPSCCPGLGPISCAMPTPGGTCPGVCAGASICTKCGDGTCGPGENVCNCPEDCM